MLPGWTGNSGPGWARSYVVRFTLQPVLPAPHLPTSSEYCCNGTVVEDKELGKVLQLQGDQRKNVSAFLIGNDLTKKDAIKVHGF